MHGTALEERESYSGHDALAVFLGVFMGQIYVHIAEFSQCQSQVDMNCNSTTPRSCMSHLRFESKKGSMCGYHSGNNHAHSCAQNRCSCVETIPSLSTTMSFKDNQRAAPNSSRHLTRNLSSPVFCNSHQQHPKPRE
ncbi:Acriflavine sensitivity control protein acr-2 [Fusarium oxysporum f. sp. albedinis]|nr:Acriflavine sensitivity control protein acr-2 [Fusarium oxysporum f. sp. albedinis]